MNRKADKTNAMRILKSKKIKYNYHSYDNTMVNAVDVANCLGQNPAMLFKTLVAVGRSGEYYVFMVPSEKELDLKKASKAAGEKSMEMIPQKELFQITGYVHGGCSPIGMKKQFRTFIDYTAESFDMIYFSAGRIGNQIELPLSELQKAIRVISADITKDTLI